jgi:YwiC-like protein
MSSTPVVPSSVRLKTIALPPEHGAWGFPLEPILVGLGVAPSVPGTALAVAVFGAFLARHPMKIALVDRLHGKRYARTALAERAALAYSVIAVIGLAATIALAGAKPLLPLLLASPLALLLFLSYSRNQGRDLLPELAGASALAGTATGIALAGNKSIGLALALWVILLARDIPSIVYVRARLRLQRGKPFSRPVVLLANVLAVACIIMLVVIGLVPVLAAVAVAVLAFRAVYGLSHHRRPVRVQTIGMLEMGYGLLLAVLVILGYALGL